MSNRERRSKQICVYDTVAKEVASNSHIQAAVSVRVRFNTTPRHTTTCEQCIRVSDPICHTWRQTD